MITVKSEWTSWSVRLGPMAPGDTSCGNVNPCRVFKIHWVIATTPGFRILAARVGNVSFIENSATDLYYVRNWDHLASIGQLDRVRVSPRIGEVGNTITVEVTNENQFGKHRFECGFIGEQLSDDWDGVRDRQEPARPAPRPYDFLLDPAAADLYADIVGPRGPYLLTSLDTPPQPADRECPECGAPPGIGCLGVKRGTFHKRREKDKHR